MPAKCDPAAKIPRGEMDCDWLLLPDGRLHPLRTGTCTIGRNPPQDVLLSHPFVSGSHAVIQLNKSGGRELSDLGSKNGTFVDGRRIQSIVPLNNGSKITIGPFSLHFRHKPASGGKSKTQIQPTPEELPAGNPAPSGRRAIAFLSGGTIEDTALLSLVGGEADFRLEHAETNPNTLLRRLRLDPVQTVVVNISTAQIDVMAFLADIASIEPAPGVFLFGTVDHGPLFQRALDAGAFGASFSSDTASETLACLRSTTAGIRSLTRAVASVVTTMRQTVQSAGPANLSDREVAVFHLIGLGKQNRAISEKLGISVKTVETHKENIKKKLDLTSSVRLTEIAENWFRQGACKPPKPLVIASERGE